jgi:hypothetical protein
VALKLLLQCGTKTAAGMVAALPWGDPHAARACVAALGGLPLRCVLGCDVLYRPHHVGMLTASAAALTQHCVETLHHTAPDFVFMIDPACVPGCTGLFGELASALGHALASSHTVSWAECSDAPTLEQCTVLLLVASPHNLPH